MHCRVFKHHIAHSLHSFKQVVLLKRFIYGFWLGRQEALEIHKQAVEQHQEVHDWVAPAWGKAVFNVPLTNSQQQNKLNGAGTRHKVTLTKEKLLVRSKIMSLINNKIPQIFRLRSNIMKLNLAHDQTGSQLP